MSFFLAAVLIIAPIWLLGELIIGVGNLLILGRWRE